MPWYELDARKMAVRTQKRLTTTPLRVVVDETSGRVLAHTEQDLGRAKGFKKVTQAEYDTLVGARRGPDAERGRHVARGAGRLELSSRWQVGADSPRKARLGRVASGGDKQALAVTLGGGRGNRVEIVRPVRATTDLKAVTIEIKPTIESGETLAVGVTLTGATDRPWLERLPQPAESGIWNALEFDFGDVPQGKLTRANMLVISLHTDADAAVCLLRSISLVS